MSDESRSAIRLTTPTDVIATVPYLLGFHPGQSFVAVGLNGKRITYAGRCDLPPEGGEPADCAEVIIPQMRQVPCREAIMLAYAPPELATPAIDAASIQLHQEGIALREALRVTGDRYWSYTCPFADCCPPEGTVYDPDASTVPAALVAAGMSAHPDRDALAAAVAPVTGSERRAMREATQEIERHCRHRWGAHLPSDLSDAEAVARLARHPEFTREGVAAMHDLADNVERSEPVPTAPEEIAWTLVFLRSIRARDAIWARIRPETLEAHLELWIRLLRHAEPRYRAAPGCLAAFAAWQTGQGALANLALNAAIQVEPNYRLAQLLSETLALGIPPNAWSFEA